MSIAQGIELAARQFEAGQLEQAGQTCRQVLELDPQNVDAIFLRGLAAHRLGALVQASDCFGQVVRLRPNYAEAYNNLAAALHDQGKLREAEANWRSAVRIKPDYAKAHNCLGVMLLRQGKVHDAVVCLQHALQVEPDNAEYHNNLGNALLTQSSYDQAVATYQRALSLKPDYAEAYNNLGLAFNAQGRLDEAIACLRECLRLRPNYVEGQNNLSGILREQRRVLDVQPITRDNLHRRSYVLGNSWQLKQLNHQERARLDTEKWVFMCNFVPTTWRLLGFRPSVWVLGDNHDESCRDALERCLYALENDHMLQERVVHVLLGIEQYPDMVMQRAARSPLKDRIITYTRYKHDRYAAPAKRLDDKMYHFGSTLTDLVNLADIFNPGSEIRLCGCQWRTRFGHYYEDFGDDVTNPHHIPFTDCMWEGLAHLRASGINVTDANFQHGEGMPESLRLPRVRLFE